MIPVTFIRNSCAVILLLFTCTQAFAQTTQNLDIAKPDTLIKNSLYNKINLIDARVDTTGFGTVQLGFFNRNAKLVVSKPNKTTAISFSVIINLSKKINPKRPLKAKR